MLTYVILAQVMRAVILQTTITSLYPSADDQQEVNNLVENITDGLQKKILAGQLLYCPLVSLCSNVTRTQEIPTTNLSNMYESCCSSCSCSEDGLLNGEQCPKFNIDTSKRMRSCIRPQYLMYGQTYFNAFYAYYMVDRCAPDFKDKEITNKCIFGQESYNVEDLLLYVPVTTLKADVIYKNRYCAICNNVRTEDIVDWNGELLCSRSFFFPKSPASQEELLQMIQKNKECNIRFDYPSMSAFRCDWGRYTKCNQTGEWIKHDVAIEHACHNYTSVYKQDYKNVFCFMCNRNVEPNMGCFGIHQRDPEPKLIGTFSGLIRYRTEPDITSIQTCRENEVFDTYKDLCRSVTCPSYYFFNSTDCVAMLSNVSYQKYEVIYKVTIRSENKTCTTEYCIHYYAVWVNKMLETYIMSSLSKAKYCGRKTEIFRLRTAMIPNTTVFFIKLFVANIYSHDSEYFVKILTSIPTKNATIDTIIVTIYTTIVSKMTFESYNLMELDKIRFLSNHDYCESELNTIRVIRNLYCPRISLSFKEVVIEGNTTFISALNITYDTNEVLRSGNHVLVCLDTYMDIVFRLESVKTTSGGDSIEEILSLICSTASIFALLGTLVAYSIFKELRTIPGINNMILSGHLIIAHALYLFGFNATSNFNLCVALGILTHYFWLSSIMWMNVCSIHLFRVFFFMRNGPGIQQSKRVLVLYSIYVISISVLLVCVNIFYYFFGKSNKSGFLGYGGNKCYITIPKMVYFTFAIPTACIVLLNIVLFFLVIYRIEKLPEFNSANGKIRRTFIIYVKLTCLTGFTWIVGFLYEFTLVKELSYTFIVLNASQGLFIFLSFCCNRRTMNACRLKLQGSQNTKLASLPSKNLPLNQNTTLSSLPSRSSPASKHISNINHATITI